MEYVKLLVSEQDYATKELLYSQMEILTVMKRYQKYKELRKKELTLKSSLRRKILECVEEVKIIDRSLPEAPIEHTPEERMKHVVEAKNRRTIETEIEDIKRKIERLQSE